MFYSRYCTGPWSLGLSDAASEIEDAGAGVQRREAPPLGVRAERLAPLRAVEMPVGGQL